MSTTRCHRHHTLVALGAAVSLFVAAGCGRTEQQQSAAALEHTDHREADDATQADAVGFRQEMRKLWEDHVTWTRLFIISAVADLPDADAAAGRLLQNQADIGDAIAPFYGADAGHALTALLREHILVAADLLTAAKAGDTSAFQQHRRDWYANADDIADFLAAANPNWSKQALRSMMREHLDQTLEEATARLTADWDGDVAAYDRIHDHILEMADVLALGIVQQFPEQFAD